MKHVLKHALETKHLNYNSYFTHELQPLFIVFFLGNYDIKKLGC
jgi:hypothetical protein